MSDQVEELARERAEEEAAMTRAVRAADEQFQSSGGSSRHWIRDCFVPALAKEGFSIHRIDAVEALRHEARRARAEGEAAAKDENTRLRGEVEQARQTAEKWAAEVTRLRREAVEKDATNTPLRERVTALEKLLSEGRAALHRTLCVGLDEGQSRHQEKQAAAAWSLVSKTIAAIDSFLGKPTSPQSAAQSDKTPIRKPEGQP